MGAISDAASFFPEAISIRSAQGDLAQISPYGAHVLGWRLADGQEVLFLSPKAEFRAGAAIRGGVPVIFPQFAGLGTLPKHGFARTALWDVARVTPDSAVMWLSETEASYRIWPHRFLAEFSARIADGRLELGLSITNTDIQTFTFTAALHSYFRVQDVREAAVVGLQGLRYRDSTRDGVIDQEIGAQVRFAGELDRTYLQAPADLQLVDDGRILNIRAGGFPDAVVWNPGAEKCAGLADMEPDGYLRFVCVEAAAAGKPVGLEPGGSWRGTQTLRI